MVLPSLLSSLSLLDEQLAAISTTDSAAMDKNFVVFIAKPLLLIIGNIFGRPENSKADAKPVAVFSL